MLRKKIITTPQNRKPFISIFDLEKPHTDGQRKRGEWRKNSFRQNVSSQGNFLVRTETFRETFRWHANCIMSFIMHLPFKFNFLFKVKGSNCKLKHRHINHGYSLNLLVMLLWLCFCFICLFLWSHKETIKGTVQPPKNRIISIKYSK